MPLKKSDEVTTEIISEAPPAPEEEVQVDARFKGSTEGVKTALRSYSENTEGNDSVEQEKEFQEFDEKITKYLTDPKCFVIIERTEPVRWRGINTAVEVDRMKCPLKISDIRARIEENWGGKKYRISLHPATPTGEMKTLTAFPMEIASEEPPYINQEETLEGPPSRRRGFRFQQEDESWADQLDPTALESGDPAIMLTNHYQGQERMLAAKMRMRAQEKNLEALKTEGEGEGNEEVRQLRTRLDFQERDRTLDDRFSKLEERLSHGNNGSDMTAALLKMMENSNQAQAQMRLEMMTQQNSMLTTFMELNRKAGPEESFDSSLDRMIKMKSAMEGKSNKFEGILMDMLSDKINGGASDDDPVSIAVKEGIEALKPVLMELVSKKPAVAQANATPLSREEAKAAYEEAGRKAAGEIAQKIKIQQENLVTKNAQLFPQHQAPQIQVSPVQAPPVQMAPPPPLRPAPEVTPPGHRVDTKSEVPPASDEEGYDRGLAINFVLSSILDDLDSGEWKNPDESYVIGDFLDRLDAPLLHHFSEINTGEGLESLIRPFASPVLVQEVKERGNKDKAVAAWLEKILVTVKGQVIDAEQAALTPPRDPVGPLGPPNHVPPPVMPSVVEVQNKEETPE